MDPPQSLGLGQTSIVLQFKLDRKTIGPPPRRDVQAAISVAGRAKPGPKAMIISRPAIRKVQPLGPARSTFLFPDLPRPLAGHERWKNMADMLGRASFFDPGRASAQGAGFPAPSKYAGCGSRADPNDPWRLRGNRY